MNFDGLSWKIIFLHQISAFFSCGYDCAISVHIKAKEMEIVCQIFFLILARGKRYYAINAIQPIVLMPRENE